MTTSFPIHTIESAPADSRPLLENLNKGIGMIPNLAATMAASPGLLKGFLALREIQHAGSFDDRDIQVLSLTNAFENGCRYCMALHSKFARNVGVSDDDVEALRRGESPSDPRLKALSDLSRKLVQGRGNVDAADLDRFYRAGFAPEHALEVVLSIAVSTMPNLAHHLTECAVDGAFAGEEWAAIAG